LILLNNFFPQKNFNQSSLQDRLIRDSIKYLDNRRSL
jgi:hypothetical protein